MCLSLLNFTTETMQRNYEASFKCLQSQGVPYNRQCNGNSIDGFTELKDEISTHQGGDVELDRPLGSEFPEPPNDFYNKTTYQHDFGTYYHMQSHR
jgi:ERI1 exoribonuclease 2